ncbi:MAG: hypothetical protein NTV62_01025 [Candidatus Gribaldobacteria bacterium]|nr:hypothetical protein [Candidatus Gribaldobacteria bacterium]
MPKETKEKEPKESGSWKKLLGGLAETLTQQATNSIIELTKHSISQINEEKNKAMANFKKMVISAILMSVGFIFLLIGIAIVINEYFTTRNSLGYILVGLTVVIGGLWLGRKK